jgi:hypothetical protein
MVHDLVQQLVDEGEVVSDLAFVELIVEVCFANDDEVVQELDHKCGIDVVLRCRNDSDVIMCRVNEAHSVKANDWRLLCCLGSYDFVAKVHDFGPGDIISKPSVD